MNKLNNLAATLVGIAVLSSAPQAANYVFDKEHTNVQFTVNHHGLSNFIGQFQEFDGRFNIDEKEIANSDFHVDIKMASVDTDVKALDDHLKNEDFFNVDKYPNMSFKSQKIIRVAKNEYVVQGDLTMLGKTRPVELNVRLNFQGRHPLASFYDKYKTDYLGFSATTAVRRSDFGMGIYAPKLADMVNITLEAELKKVKE